MPVETVLHTTLAEQPRTGTRPADPCLLVIFGASGDLTRRLLMPALYNLTCDGLLPKHFAIVGLALDDLTTEQFQARMSADIRTFSTRTTFDAAKWDDFVGRLHYTPGNFADPAAYKRLENLAATLDAEHQLGGNIVFYFATPPSVFGLISDNLGKAGLTRHPGSWRRVIVEKPFGYDLPSAVQLNRELLTYWTEDQVYRIDHYLGKETVQNILTFRFANGIFEPLWNKNHIDHIQFSVAETVGVEGRGKYYDRTGVLRDMMQNHMFQMLAYLCMEPPNSFRADAIRNEKAKLLDSVRVMTPEEVVRNTVRGQYGPGVAPDGKPAPGYREEPDVDPHSATDTFAAMKLYIDNWRWEGVPVYLRSGKRLWKRGTEIMVQFKRAPEVIFRDTPAAERLDSNRLLFHVQPDQGIELRFHAKQPGPAMHLQKVNMRFDYREAFEASRGTGYEVLLYSCMVGDQTLFSRTDLVESAWKVAQPVLDVWASAPPTDFPNYPAGSWGPKAAYDLIGRDGRRWMEVVNRDALARVPLLKGADAVCLHTLAMALRPAVYDAGDYVVRKGDPGREMYFICRGRAEAVADDDRVLKELHDGDYFGELALLSSKPRAASVRAVTPLDLFVLDQTDFNRVVEANPAFAATLEEVAKTYRG